MVSSVWKLCCSVVAIVSVCLASARSEIEWGAYVPTLIDDTLTDRPWVTDLAVGDLSGDGVVDVAYCEGKLNYIGLLKGAGDVGFSLVSKLKGVEGPAHVEIDDFDGDGDGDLLIACMGVVFPNNDKIGSVVIAENLGGFRFEPRVVLEDVARVTDVRAGDIDGDGDKDLSVAQFGYYQGELRYMENLGDWRLRSVLLSDLPGAIHAPIDDVDGDGDLDIVALISQQWEEIHVFENSEGTLRGRIAFASPNEDFGSSGIALEDLDGDGDRDILYTNGDGFDYALPGPRLWHGVQWLENDGIGNFEYKRVGDFPGAYSPVAVDGDGDGDMDIVVASCFNDWTDEEAYSLACFENLGDEKFVFRPLASEPTHIVVVKAVDLDGDGIEELVTGGFHAYPPWDRMSGVAVWRRTIGE